MSKKFQAIAATLIIAVTLLFPVVSFAQTAPMSQSRIQMLETLLALLEQELQMILQQNGSAVQNVPQNTPVSIAASTSTVPAFTQTPIFSAPDANGARLMKFAADATSTAAIYISPYNDSRADGNWILQQTNYGTNFTWHVPSWSKTVIFYKVALTANGEEIDATGQIPVTN